MVGGWWHSEGGWWSIDGIKVPVGGSFRQLTEGSLMLLVVTMLLQVSECN